MKSSRKYIVRFAALSLFGLLIIAASAYFRFFLEPRLFNLSSMGFSISGRYMGSQPDERLAALDLRFPAERITGEVIIQPEKIFAQQSFILEYIIRGQLIVPLPEGHTEPAGYGPSEWLNERLPGAKVKLELASGVVLPEGFQEIPEDFRVSWNVSLPTAKDHMGFITIKSDNLPNGGGKDAIEITVEPEKREVDWWFWIVSVFGLAVAITNIVKFIWAFRDRQSS